MKEIVLTQGKVALVDDEDFDRLSEFKWRAKKKDKTYYAVRSTSRAMGLKSITIYMHREIIKSDLDIDHVNRNGLDNQKHNLRPCTKAQNQWNVPIHSNNTSGLKGVVFSKRDNVWYARIACNGKRKHIGSFTTKEEAAAAYKKEANVLHGVFARP